MPMSSVADSHVRTSASQARAPDLPASVRDSGGRWFEPFAWFDRDGSCWRTFQCCWIEGWERFSETWPKTGMTRNGIAYRLLTSEPARIENASGYWQTPTTRDSKGQSGLGNRTRRGTATKLHVANLCDQLVDIGRPDLVRSVTFREWLMGLPIGFTDLKH